MLILVLSILYLIYIIQIFLVLFLFWISQEEKKKLITTENRILLFPATLIYTENFG